MNETLWLIGNGNQMGMAFLEVGAKRCCRLDKELNTVEINISGENQRVEAGLGTSFLNLYILFSFNECLAKGNITYALFG